MEGRTLSEKETRYIFLFSFFEFMSPRGRMRPNSDQPELTSSRSEEGATRDTAAEEKSISGPSEDKIRPSSYHLIGGH